MKKKTLKNYLGLDSELDYLDGLGVKTIVLHNFVDLKQPKELSPIYGNAQFLNEFKKKLKSKCM